MKSEVKTAQRAVTTYVDQYTLVLTLSLEEVQALYRLLHNMPTSVTDETELATLMDDFHDLLRNIGKVPT